MADGAEGGGSGGLDAKELAIEAISKHMLDPGALRRRFGEGAAGQAGPRVEDEWMLDPEQLERVIREAMLSADALRGARLGSAPGASEGSGFAFALRAALPSGGGDAPGEAARDEARASPERQGEGAPEPSSGEGSRSGRWSQRIRKALPRWLGGA